MEKGPITLYCGFDPTADSLHLGHLVQIFTLRRFQQAGHRPIALIGGGTGLIGDPSGKTEERKLLDQETLSNNTIAIRKQLSSYLDFDTGGKNDAVLLNNADWLEKMDLVSFLRNVGKFFSVNVMLSREAVKRRLRDGISFTEFTYQVLQSFDFFVLFKEHGCSLQIGGSDQYGNITAGLDFIRRMYGHEAKAFGLTTPLITQASGEKFGKTAKGTVWLDPERTSPYEFFQYFVNRDDQDVAMMLKRLTFLSLSDIDELIAAHTKAPEKREAQRILANEITRLVHGQEGLDLAQRITQTFFGKGSAIHGFTDTELLPILRDVVNRHAFLFQ